MKSMNQKILRIMILNKRIKWMIKKHEKDNNLIIGKHIINDNNIKENEVFE